MKKLSQRDVDRTVTKKLMHTSSPYLYVKNNNYNNYFQ